MNIYSVYLFKNTKDNNKPYIGVSVNFKARKDSHFSRAIKHNNYREESFAAAIKNFGKGSFTWELIYQSKDKNHTFEMETYFIKEYNSYYKAPGGFGYNLTTGGENPPNATGRIMLENTKRKIGDANRGRIKSEDERRRISEGNKGRIYTLEERKRLSEIQKERYRKNPPIKKEKLPKKSLKGVKRPQELMERITKSRIENYENTSKYKFLVVYLPTREYFMTHNLSEFSRNKGFHHKAMVGSTFKHDELVTKHNLGYVAYHYIEGMEINLPEISFYEFVDPKGNKTITTKYCLFCKKNNLTPQCIEQILRGVQHQHKGWTVKRITITGQLAHVSNQAFVYI